MKLTSPQMRGKDVTILQKRLAGRNKWNHNFHPGGADGSFGPYTGAAVHRAKEFLGYPRNKINKHAGDQFAGYLSGETPLPRMFKIRMKRRLKKINHRRVMRTTALKSAMKKVGLKETPQGSNHNYLTDWWYGRKGAQAAWCCISVSDSYIDAGSTAFKRGDIEAYVPFLENYAADGRHGLMRIKKSEVKPGDVVTFNFDGGVADHVGIFIEWINEVSGTFRCVEGNTDAAGGAEGGEQMVRDRSMPLVSQFIRVMK